MGRKVFIALLFIVGTVTIAGRAFASGQLRQCRLDSNEMRAAAKALVNEHARYGRRPGTPAAVAIYQTDVHGNIIAAILEQRVHDRQPVASIQKLVTAYVAYRLGYFNTRTTFTQEDYMSWEGEGHRPRLVSGRPVATGQSVTVGELVYPMLSFSQSCNQAAYAIGRTIETATRTPFPSLMNQVMRVELGASESSFADPSGLSSSQYSTANDMARFLGRVMANPGFRAALEQQGFYTLRSGFFEKSGYTAAVGRTRIAHLDIDQPNCEPSGIEMAVFTDNSLHKEQIHQFDILIGGMADLVSGSRRLAQASSRP